MKVLADAATGRCHMIGAMTSELIAEAVAPEFKSQQRDIARIITHPTLSEVLHEAALAVDRLRLVIMGE